MGDMEIPDEPIDRLLGEYEGPEQLTGPDGSINRLRKRLIERAAGASWSSISVFRWAESRPKGSRTGVTAACRRRCGRSTGRSRSSCLAIEVTASIQDDVRAWQGRPLEELYLVVYLDAIQVAILHQRRQLRQWRAQPTSVADELARLVAAVGAEERTAQEVNAAASGLRVGDDQLHAAKATLDQAAQEAAPEGLRLGPHRRRARSPRGSQTRARRRRALVETGADLRHLALRDS
jgi:hypothetical protein